MHVLGRILSYCYIVALFLPIHQWFPLVQTIPLGYNTLHAKIGLSTAKVTLEFYSICNKFFYLEKTKVVCSYVTSFDIWNTNFWCVIFR